MDKKDIMYLVAALALVLIIALVVKPMVTGQPVNTGLPVPATTLVVTAVQAGNATPAGPAAGTLLPTPIPTTPPTPAPTWNPGSAASVQFVDPSLYGISLNQTLPGGTRFNESSPDRSMTTFATIASGTGSSGTTDIMYIPFPYWEMVYTVDPSAELEPGKIEASETQEGAPPHSGIEGSYSTVRPEFSVIVMDGNDPNRIVRTVTPPGGIDADLWAGIKQESHEESSVYESRKKSSTTDDEEEDEVVDPRPWTEKFYEGQRSYYFIIKAQSLESYSITVQVPTRYIGKY